LSKTSIYKNCQQTADKSKQTSEKETVEKVNKQLSNCKQILEKVNKQLTTENKQLEIVNKQLIFVYSVLASLEPRRSEN